MTSASTAELARALAVLAEPPGPEHARLADVLDLPPPPERTVHADVFLFQLHPHASVHLGEEGMLGGAAADRIAGLWRAVGRRPPADADGLAALLGLWAALREEADGAGGEGAEGGSAEGRLVAHAADAVLREALAPWLPLFLDRTEELGGAFYAAWARLARRWLEEEVARSGGMGPLPEALRRVSRLPHPDEAGGAAFARALLAPARTGMIVTRADLALLARDLGLGLRAGERFFVLGHLLDQDPPGALEGLAGLARRAERAAGAWNPVLAPLSAWWAERARGTAELLAGVAGRYRAAAASGSGSAPAAADGGDA